MFDNKKGLKKEVFWFNIIKTKKYSFAYLKFLIKLLNMIYRSKNGKIKPEP